MNNLKRFLRKEEEDILIDASLKQQLLVNFQPTRRRHFLPFLFPALLAIAVALVIVTSPFSPTTEASFLKKAQAAYEQAAERATAEGLVHHTVEQIIENGVPDTSSEKWTLPQEAFVYYEASKNGELYYRALTIGETLYVTPKENALARSIDADFPAGPPAQYTLQTPSNVSGVHYEGDPEDPTVMCYSFDWKTDEQLSEEKLFEDIFANEDESFSLDRMPELLKLLEDPRIEDLGEVTLETGELVHAYRFVRNDGPQEDPMISTHEFYFNPSTYMLVTHRWVTEMLGNTPQVTDFHFVTNEFLPVTSFDASFFTPEGHGLEEMYNSLHHPENYATFEMEEGCMRNDDESPVPVYLSPEEEAEVRARIRAIQQH